MMSESLNAYLDALARASIVLSRKSWSAFRICGLGGLALASALSLSLAIYLGLSLWVEAALVLTAVPTFYLFAMSIKVTTGVERFTYYHHQIVFLLSSALLLKLLHQPVLPYLDVSILGVGLLMACGRIGCLMVGCCHGKPSLLGIAYGAEHAAAGFRHDYVGVRLFPVQVVEAAWVLCVVSVGVALLLQGSAPQGTALSWYVVAYALGRFVFEFARGDAERPYLRGFSEAQWTSLFLVCATLCAELAGLIVFQRWHAGALVLLSLLMLAVALRRRLRKTNGRKLLHSPVNFQKGERELAR
ncbi:MAG: prolipoprotein diacylglyceryl transferase family protein [Pyrinomonadaceae bacterium]